MRRIGLVLALTVSFALLPLTTGAQQARTWRLAVLGIADSIRWDAFRQGLREQGYIEGRNLSVEYRYYGVTRADGLDVLARELVRLKVDVIVTEGTPATLAVRRATDSIPIVVASAGDLIGIGLVASLARPGGNVTGLTLQSPEIAGKRLALLKELVPTANSIAILMNPLNRLLPLVFSQTQEAAQTLSLKLQPFEVDRPEDFEATFATIVRNQSRALLVPLDSMFNTHARRLSELATKNRLPAVFGERNYVEVGGLASYGPSYADMYRHAAVFVDKILKGAKPAELPVEQPTKFELVINLKTAKALGLTIPQSILVRADEIIQ